MSMSIKEMNQMNIKSKFIGDQLSLVSPLSKLDKMKKELEERKKGDPKEN